MNPDTALDLLMLEQTIAYLQKAYPWDKWEGMDPQELALRDYTIKFLQEEMEKLRNE
jgi:hypothetical protein